MASIPGNFDKTGRRRRGAVRGAAAHNARRKSPEEAFSEPLFESEVVRQRGKQQSSLFAPMEGFPAWEGLRPVMSFLAFPAMLVLAITVTGGHWPKPLLYGIAMLLGGYVAASAWRTNELILACLLLYLPFSKVYVIPIAPMVNGTNVLLLLGIFAAVLQAGAHRYRLFQILPGTLLVFAFGAWSIMSAFTVLQHAGGWNWFLYNNALNFKSWLDQFVFFGIAIACVRDREMAKRMVIYMMIGTVLLVFYGIPEMLEKAGRSSIEKSRLEGPHQQSNNYGGFLAYTLLPMAALFMMYMRDWRVWLMTPYFLLTIKLLITTFSRGAYVAMAAGGLVAAWYRGKGFLAFWTVVSLCFFLAFPSAIPDAITDRMGTVTGDSARGNEEALDDSSNTRLIMWRAAIQMMKEDPLLGKGFKAFPLLKEDYIHEQVKESDPHSMYFSLGAEMGVPALLMFLCILGYAFFMGRRLALHGDDKFIRTIGIGGASLTVCFAVICIFGSRAVSLNVTSYFWMYFVVMQVLLWCQDEATTEVTQRANQRQRRRNLALDGGVAASVSQSQLVNESTSGSSSRPARSVKPRRQSRQPRGARPMSSSNSLSRTEHRSTAQEQKPSDSTSKEKGQSRLAAKRSRIQKRLRGARPHQDDSGSS